MNFNWRIYILSKLVECYMEGDKKTEDSKALDKIGEILKKKEIVILWMKFLELEFILKKIKNFGNG